jgi:hypothetical protein
MMNNLTDIINYFTSLALKVVPLLAVIAFLVFAIGVGRFIKSAGDGKDIKDTKKILIWGVIGLFVLTSIWGIVSFIRGELGFSTNVGIPQIRIGQ